VNELYLSVASCDHTTHASIIDAMTRTGGSATARLTFVLIALVIGYSIIVFRNF